MGFISLSFRSHASNQQWLEWQLKINIFKWLFNYELFSSFGSLDCSARVKTKQTSKMGLTRKKKQSRSIPCLQPRRVFIGEPNCCALTQADLNAVWLCSSVSCMSSGYEKFMYFSLKCFYFHQEMQTNCSFFKLQNYKSVKAFFVFRWTGSDVFNISTFLLRNDKCFS